MDIAHLYQIYTTSTGVCTDTRNIAKGNLFFALKGPNFDANTFAGKALEAGVLAVVVDSPSVVPQGDSRYILVEDVLKALQRLARYHRDKLTIPIVALTGSNGKTTTKELIYQALHTKLRTYATKGNLNNHIGVPLTVLAIGPEVQIAVIEMGANKPGDIRELCEIANPTHGLITNIGKAHLEGMGGYEGVLKTKTELFQHLKENKGTVFINTRQSVFTQMIRRFESPVLFPDQGSFCEVKFLSADPFVRFAVGQPSQEYTSQLIGEYNFDNIAAAVTVGTYFGVPVEVAAAAVAAYVPNNMRSQIIEKRSNKILLDAYNANPTSMEAALRMFGKMDDKPNKMVIIGDMFELGEYAEQEHHRLGGILAELKLDKICLSGTLVQHALPAVPAALYFPDPFSLRNWLLDSKLENYLILIKGSRSMKLETLVDCI